MDLSQMKIGIIFYDLFLCHITIANNLVLEGLIPSSDSIDIF